MANAVHYMDKKCRYFKKAGSRNTRAVLEATAERAGSSGIKKILVATCSGKTGLMAREVFSPDASIIAVTHVTGFAKPNVQELGEKAKKELESKGVWILTCQHAFGGIGRGIRNKLSTYQVDEVMAYTLRTFGHGTKVAIEIALMAADAGLVRSDEEIISVGGTGEGADTALVLQPANSFRFFDLKVKEIICKPSSF